MATVVFVCPHGALKSRIAAALFNACAVPGWRAVSAGVEPQEAVSVHAVPLLAGTPAARLLDLRAPSTVAEAGPAEVVVAIDCELDGTRPWRLRHGEPGEAMCEELSGLVMDLVGEVGR